MLDAIFTDCFRRWGGRFNLLVPCENRSIRPSYLPWIELYDPDIIYSYVDLTESEILELHERLYPSFLVHHDLGRTDPRDERAYQPNLPVAGLSALSAAYGPPREHATLSAQPVELLDSYYGHKPSQFVHDNFGCYGTSLAPWPMPDDMLDFVRPLTWVPETADQHHLASLPNIVKDEGKLLEAISRDRNLIGLAQLSAWRCPRLEFRDPQWAESMNLVVGDSFVDRVVFWNGRSHLPVWLDNNLATLKVSRDRIEDPDFFARLLEILRKRVRVGSGSAGPAQIKLRSGSLTQPELEALREKFRAEDSRHWYTAEAGITLDSCVPSAEALKHSRPLAEEAAPFSSENWHEITFSDPMFRPPLIYPRHLRDIRPLPSATREGAWALDVDIECGANHRPFQNVQHYWRLPFRLRMVEAFAKPYTPSRGAPICMPRATWQGLLSLFGVAEGQLPEIKIPTDETAFRTALCGDRTWWPFDRFNHTTIRGPVFDTRPSDKGRYLTGLLQRSGGIHRAAEIFLNQFWKEQFENLGTTAAATDAQLEEVVRKLKKKLRDGKISSDDDWHRIARLVQAEARALRFSDRRIQFDTLSDGFEGFRNAFWQVNVPGAPREEWDEDEKRSLEISVQYLCQRGILYQGHEWRCPRCCNKNGVGIAALAQSMECEVCGRIVSAPVTAPWHFKLDEFISEGLREHSMLSNVWCLKKLAEEARRECPRFCVNVSRV